MAKTKRPMYRLCPDCHRQLQEKFTWRGILYAIFCFPCGIFFCYRKRRLQCPSCNYEVIISDGSVPTIAQAYKHYKEFKWEFSTKKKDESTTDKTEPATDSTQPNRPSTVTSGYGSTDGTDMSTARPSTSSRD